MTRHQTKLTLAQDLAEFFQNEVRSVAKKQGVEMSPFAQNYLAAMLDRFQKTEHFLLKHLQGAEDSDSANAFPRLANLWLESFAKPHSEQLLHLQSLGDFALFTRGFFSERITKTLVDADYYTAVGERAYERAGQIRETLVSERALNTFFELAENFDRYSEVLAELADQNLTASDKDLLKLYEKWLANRSHRIARMLAENGIIASGGVAANPTYPSGGSGTSD